MRLPCERSVSAAVDDGADIVLQSHCAGMSTVSSLVGAQPPSVHDAAVRHPRSEPEAKLLRVNPRRSTRAVVDREMEPHQAPMQRHTQGATYRADCVCPNLDVDLRAPASPAPSPAATLELIFGITEGSGRQQPGAIDFGRRLVEGPQRLLAGHQREGCVQAICKVGRAVCVVAEGGLHCTF